MRRLNRLNQTILIALGLALMASYATADVNKGKKIYMKKMKSACGFSGAKFATKHTQSQWEAKKSTFAKEAGKICPGLKLKSKYVNDVYDFAHKFASDSGNVPSC